MFTGIIAEVGEVETWRRVHDGARLRVRAALSDEVKAGHSVAVEGVCLTALEVGPRWFEADLSCETTARSSLGRLRPGDKVNLELALTPSSRLGGHLVQGHVDGTGVVRGLDPVGGGWRLTVDVPCDLSGYIVEKGPIAVAGISLTVARFDGAAAEAAVIPFTYERTTLKYRRPGDAVNLEVDLLAKYVERLSSPAAGGLSAARLTELGYDV